jgi:hypothetical protein
VVVALVLGYKIYEKKSDAPVSNTPITTNTQNAQQDNIQQDAPSAITNSQIPVGDLAILRAAIAPSATDEQKEAFFSTVNKYAVNTNSIEITSCLPEPIVAAVKQGGEITLVNNGSKTETIAFDPSHTYTVGAKTSKKIKADLGHGLGDYGYTCPDKEGVAGIVSIR